MKGQIMKHFYGIDKGAMSANTIVSATGSAGGKGYVSIRATHPELFDDKQTSTSLTVELSP